jgi:hypothetical protein
MASCSRQGNAGDRAHGEHKSINRIKGITSLGDLGEQIVCDDVSTTEVTPKERNTRIFCPNPTIGEVDSKNLILD